MAIKVVQFRVGDDIEFAQGTVLCLGFFDGVHTGHLALIEKAIATGLPVAVLTMDRPPKAYLAHENLRTLTSPYDKANILEKLGVKYLYVLHFNEETSLMTKDEFIHNVLDKINPVHIFVGEDYRFGFQGQGDPLYLEMFYPVTVIPLLYVNGEKVSSRYISNLISSGDIVTANALLGRNYSLSGVVVRGLGNGAKLGIPTANIELDYNYITPPQGVYATYTIINERRRKSLTSISTHPTIQELEKPIIENYILDYNDNLYGKTIEIEFVAKIREIMYFNNTDDLLAQIKLDTETAKKYLQ